MFFTAEAAMDFFAYFKARKYKGSGWILFDGVVTLLLGLLIWRQWPLSSRVGNWDTSWHQYGDDGRHSLDDHAYRHRHSETYAE